MWQQDDDVMHGVAARAVFSLLVVVRCCIRLLNLAWATSL